VESEVVGIVGGRHLDAAGAEGRIDMLIGDDRDAVAHQGQLNGAAHQSPLAGIGGIHGYGGVAEHRLGAGGGDHQVVAGVPLHRLQRIALLPGGLPAGLGAGRVVGLGRASAPGAGWELAALGTVEGRGWLHRRKGHRGLGSCRDPQP